MAEPEDPFNPTFLRPRPGGGRRGAGEAARSPSQPAAPAWPEADPIAPDLRSHLGIGLNPLVRAASPLLLLAGQIRGSLAQMDVAGLRRQALEDIHRFETQTNDAGVANEVMMAARYALCAGLDEAVLSTPWGAQSEWSQHPLLVQLHREAWGGEKFFEVIERVSKDPGRYIDVMELLYLCLSMGFAGKYHVMERGHERLAEVQQGLYRKIRNHRHPPEADLSLRWRGLDDRRNPIVRYIPWWVIGAGALAILAIVFTAYYAGLGRAAAPVHAELAKLGRDAFTAPVEAPPAAGPTLKQLLAPEEQRGALIVEEQGGRTLVTFLAGDLFTSGSASVSPGYRETLFSVARAINRVPGRVLVVGHTDDQPIRSLRFQDNFELSRERAVSVVRILQEVLDNDGRLSWTGVGASEPRYRPESAPENRARNRRVELVHVRESDVATPVARRD